MAVCWLQRETQFELKLNVTNTEFVVVDDTTTWDTNAVVLKVCRVLCRNSLFFYLAILNNVDIRLIYVANGVMAGITPSSHLPCAEISKMASHERLCNRSLIGSGKPMIGCENRADSQH